MKVDEKNSNICITNNNYGSSIFSNEELPMKINMNNESSESQQSFYFSIKTIQLGGGGNNSIRIGIINADDWIINRNGSCNSYGYSLYDNQPIINTSFSDKVKSK